MRLLQLLEHWLHMGHWAALGPETNAPKMVKQFWKQTQPQNHRLDKLQNKGSQTLHSHLELPRAVKQTHPQKLDKIEKKLENQCIHTGYLKMSTPPQACLKTNVPTQAIKIWKHPHRLYKPKNQTPWHRLYKLEKKPPMQIIQTTKQAHSHTPTIMINTNSTQASEWLPCGVKQTPTR